MTKKQTGLCESGSYDAAQERGEVATRQNNSGLARHVPNKNMPATAADIGLTCKQIHEARAVPFASSGPVARTTLPCPMQPSQRRPVVRRAASVGFVSQVIFPLRLKQSATKSVIVDGSDRAGPGCLNRISASISGASAGVRLPDGAAAG